jgi:hypothetical protein
MLIARILPLMTIYTVRGGQRKGSKHVINFRQNVTRIASELPMSLQDIPMIVRRLSNDGTRHYDFRVQQQRVRDALIWLKDNHKWYRDIIISEEQLQELPADDNVEAQFLREMEAQVDGGLQEGEDVPVGDGNRQQQEVPVEGDEDNHGSENEELEMGKKFFKKF